MLSNLVDEPEVSRHGAWALVCPRSGFRVWRSAGTAPGPLFVLDQGLGFMVYGSGFRV